jgi:signal transduction histidine kinase
MRVIARLPDVPGWGEHAGAGRAIARLRRHRLELLWGAFVTANSAAMLLWSQWETIPFYLIWISLTLLYGLKVWPLRATMIVLVTIMVLTGVPIVLHVGPGAGAAEKVIRVPLMAMLFLAVVWHARRRVEALRIAELRAEELHTMLERQERFIHDASHELRTPVTIARGHLELLSGERMSGELDVPLDELRRIDAIIERLLVLAAADQPDFLRPADVQVEPFLEDVFMRWSEVANRTWRLGPLANVTLSVDPERLRAALDALFENAIKYTNQRDAIELRAHRVGAGRILIEVEDEGSGVQEEALERIFDRFARADAARTRSTGGVGLGLAIVDAIAKAHGGRCTVRNTGHGSVFALQLSGVEPAPAPQRLSPPQFLPELSPSSS